MAAHPTLQERFAAAADRLTRSESEVASYLVEHRQELAFLSAEGIADAVGVSDTTVIRTVRALGYKGLVDLKQQMHDRIVRRTSFTPVYERGLDSLGLDPTARLDHLIAAQIEVLTQARQSLRGADFERALELLDRAERIMVVGIGPLSALAHYFVLYLRRIGRAGSAVTGQSSAFVDELVELRPGHALVLLAYSQLLREHKIAAAHAATLGVPCVLITDHLALALQGGETVALTAERGEMHTVTSLVVPAAIIEALIFGLIGSSRTEAFAALDNLDRLRDRLRNS